MSAPVGPVVIAAGSGSRLEALAEAYALAKPAADAAKAHLDSITDAIKVELANTAPGATKIDLTSPALDGPLRMQAKTTWRLDSKKLKEQAPAVYAQYAVQNTYWELRAVANRSGSL